MSTPSSTILEEDKSFAQKIEGSSEFNWASAWKFRGGEDVPSYDVEILESQTDAIVEGTVCSVLYDNGVVAPPWTKNRNRKRVHFATSPDNIVIKSDGLDAHAQDILRVLRDSTSTTLTVISVPGYHRDPRIHQFATNELTQFGFHVSARHEGTTDSPDTTSRNQVELVMLSLGEAFEKAADELFEDGMESAFSRTLKDIIRTYGVLALAHMDSMLSQERVSAEVGGEALRQLGLIEHHYTQTYRLAILSKYLKSNIMQFRDAASLGISFMDDPSAIVALRVAISKESSAGIKRNLEQVLEQLLDTQRWRDS